MKFFSVAFLCLNLLFSSCKTEEKNVVKESAKNSIKYAKGFDIHYFKDYIKIIIKAPYPDATTTLEYVVYSKDAPTPDIVKEYIGIQTPVDRIVVTSTTHIPMLELLGVENSLIGFPNSQYISSEKTRQRLAGGAIKELGKGEHINTEALLAIEPEVVVSFSVTANNKMFNTIEQAGIPVILNGDWLEETPLGRAEWIKFFGALYNKEKEADSIFTIIETSYLASVAIAKKAKNRPTVLSGVLFKDSWNLPAGDSFVAHFLKDANTNYLWKHTSGKGSLSLSFETVFESAKDADFWIAPGHYKSLQQLETANEHYCHFTAFQEGNIYSFANTMGPTGGVLYYELAPVQPHIVLKDIIKIVHPELVPDYKPFFLKKMQ